MQKITRTIATNRAHEANQLCAKKKSPSEIKREEISARLLKARNFSMPKSLVIEKGIENSPSIFKSSFGIQSDHNENEKLKSIEDISSINSRNNTARKSEIKEDIMNMKIINIETNEIIDKNDQVSSEQEDYKIDNENENDKNNNENDKFNNEDMEDNDQINNENNKINTNNKLENDQINDKDKPVFDEQNLT